jgi:glucose-1-phosphate thymidylyltransferase
LTYSQPKHLIPIANRPVIEWILATIHSAGISDAAIVVSPSTESAFRAALGDGGRFGVDLSYIVQDEPKGLAHAVVCSEGCVAGEPFLLYLGDNLFEAGVRGLVEVFESEDCSAAISLVGVEDPRRFGVARVEAGRIVHLVEKPERPPSNLAVAGAYVFDAHIFEAIGGIRPSARGELEITDAIQALIDDRLNVFPHEVEGWWKDVGRPRDMLIANELLVEQLEPSITGSVDGDTVLEGKVTIGPETVIERSTITGPVVIGEGARLRHATIGPNVSLGDGCILEDCCVEHSILMDGASVRGVGRIGWSILGREAEVTKDDSSAHVTLLMGDRCIAQLR